MVKELAALLVLTALSNVAAFSGGCAAVSGVLRTASKASSLGAGLYLRGGCAEVAAEAPAAETAEAPSADIAKNGFDLDSWKRTYSNADDTNTVLPQFWEDYDKEGWSVWLTEYKNNEDYKKRLMASNLIGGWFQRLDGTGARKVAFGNGQEIPQEFKDVADFEQWDWTKVDTDDEAMRKVVNDYMRWDGDFGKNRKWVTGKTYK